MKKKSLDDSILDEVTGGLSVNYMAQQTDLMAQATDMATNQVTNQVTNQATNVLQQKVNKKTNFLKKKTNIFKKD